MLVRKYSVISIIKDMFKEKKMTIAIVIVCTLLGGLWGFFTYQKDVSEQKSLETQISSEYIEGEEEYVTELRNYEQSMAACEEAYAIAVEQRDTLQEYIDNSILMKINPDNVQVAYVAYVVQDTGNTGNILNSMQSYIYDGGLKEDALIKGAEELGVEGWRELINVGVSGNNLFITISHYDADKVREIMKVVKDCVEEQTPQISKTQGDYTLVLSDESYYTKTDSYFANTQNSNNNNLKAYENSIADQLTKINNLANAINDYKAKYEIKEGNSINRGLPLNIVLYCIVGLAGGVVLSFTIMITRVSVSNKILNAHHLQYAGLTVYNVYNQKKKEFILPVDETVREVKKMTENNSLCLYSLSEIETNKEIIDKLIEKISGEVKDNSGLCDCKEVLVVLTENKDTYSALEELIAKCSRLDINLLGIVVSE